MNFDTNFLKTVCGLLKIAEWVNKSTYMIDYIFYMACFPYCNRQLNVISFFVGFDHSSGVDLKIWKAILWQEEVVTSSI